MDDQAYLEADFDPSSLTVPRLRSILVAHSVSYPSSAKKSQLVDLFNQHVVPQARKLRAANARVKRTSRGIENVPGQGSANDYDPVPEPTPTAGSSRRTTRARTEEAEDVIPVRAVRHGTAPPEYTPRRSPSEHVETDEEPLPKRSSSKRSRLSATTPVAKRDNAEEEDSPFTNDNVFQSGGSPPLASDTDRRRTTSGVVRESDRMRNRDNRKITRDAMRMDSDAVSVPPRRKTEMPVSILKEPRQEIEISEEFTPEESQELAQAQQSGTLVNTRRGAKRPVSTAARVAPVAVVVALLAGFGAVWSREKFDVGYCGVGRPATKIGGVEVPEWADFIRPQCEPCPPHAFCYDRLETRCEPDFVLTPHPLSLKGLLPLTPTCEPDSAKARKVNAVKERAIEVLREQNARFECNEASSPEIREPELKKVISTKRRRGMSNQEFDELWESAIGDIQNAEEVVSGSDGSPGILTLRSTSLARLPLSCAFRRSLRETLRQYFWQLIMLLTVVGSSTYAHHYITSGHETEERAKELAKLALNKLAQQASLHTYDPDAYRENYMSVAQLRDDVLRDEFSASRRTKLWAKVQRKVEGNSNVRPMVREGRFGDVGRVWEWIGAVSMIESTSSGEGQEGHRRRRSGRVSFGGAEERLIEAREDSETSQVGRWHEPGPYY